MHPNNATLIAYQDGGLDSGGERAVARHLEGCPRCARQLEEFAADWNLLLAADAPFRTQCVPGGGGLGRLMEAIRNWREAAGNPAEMAETRRRAEQCLSVYFGQETAALLDAIALNAASEEGLAKAIQPKLAAFLGSKAAEAVMRQILNRGEGGLWLQAEMA